ncbi:hypothetical protein D9M73_90650 [compost metagenome]
MHNVIPLDQVDRQTVKSMAESAADNGLPPCSNPLPENHQHHAYWQRCFHERDIALAGVD